MTADASEREDEAGEEPQEEAGPVERAADARSEISVLKDLLPYLRPYIGRTVLVFLLILAANVASLLVPFILKSIVDKLNVELDLMVLPLVLLLAYGAARISVTLFTELRQVVFARVMARASRDITLRVFRHLHTLSLRFHLDRRTGGVARDIERGGSAIIDLLGWSIYTLLPTLLEVLLVTIVLTSFYGFGFALITLFTLIGYTVWTFIVTEWRTRFFRATVEADTRANERAVDSLINYETVKFFNNESHEASRYASNLRVLENATVKAQTSLAILNLGQAVIIGIGVTAIMLRASAGVVAAKLTLGDIVLVNAYVLQLSAPLYVLGMVYREVKAALANMERMFSLLDEQPDIEDRTDAIPLTTSRPDVCFENVCFGYDDRRRILHHVDFEIPAGGTVAIVGHSGSGKSTLTRLLYRFYDVDEGRVMIDGRDIRDYTQDSVRAAIAIVPQDTVFFNDTILYNIRYGRTDANRADVEQAARAAHIHDFIMQMPDGYNTGVGERGLKLSGGEKQRVAIARALMKDPGVLIFDEATSSLDSKSEKLIQAELDRIKVGRTTLVIAHRLSTVMNADQILVMDGGRIVERGRHSELLRTGGQYAQMWRLQQEEEDSPAEVDAE